MEVAELHRKHLGGQLLFSPDGLLHIILGDGMITLDDMEEMDGLRWDPWSDKAKHAQCQSFCHAHSVIYCLLELQRFHRLRPEGGCGHRLLHVPVFHPPKKPLLQQHQPATWDLCPWFTWPRQVSEASKWTLNELKHVRRSEKHPGSLSAERCRCAVDRLRAENGSFLILCTDASGKNSTAGRILEIAKGKDYGELKFPWHLPWPSWFSAVSVGLFE